MRLVERILHHHRCADHQRGGFNERKEAPCNCVNMARDITHIVKMYCDFPWMLLMAAHYYTFNDSVTIVKSHNISTTNLC